MEKNVGESLKELREMKLQLASSFRRFFWQGTWPEPTKGIVWPKKT